MADLETLLGQALAQGAELRIASGKPAALAVPGELLQDISESTWTAAQIFALLDPVLNDERMKTLRTQREITLKLKVEDHKFRIRVQQEGDSVTLRAKPDALAAHLTMDEGTQAGEGGQKSLQLGALKRNLIGSDKGRGALPELLATLEEQGASHLHLRDGRRPCLRVGGKILELADLEPLDGRSLRRMIGRFLSEEQQADLDRAGGLDFAYRAEDGARFRVNVFIESASPALVARRVPTRIPTYESLGLPAGLGAIPSLLQGLVLVCGASGAGTSSTLAATVEAINQARQCTIVTLEDPIAFAFKSRTALIAQREIGIDCGSWGEALRDVLHQDADVILLGEIRDQQAIECALDAAEAGRLVLGALRSSTTVQALTRVIESFPASRHLALRQSLAINLRAIVCQRLVPAVAGGVVPAVELLLNSPSVSKLLREGREDAVDELLLADDDMLSFNESLRDLVAAGTITERVASDHAPRPEKLKALLGG